MAVEATIPTLSVIVVSAAIDSINPCAIGVLILMLSVLISQGKSTGRMFMLGGIYIASVYVTYFLAGLGLMYFLANVPLYITEYISLTVGLFIIFAGFLEIKDFFWYGKGFSLSIPPSFAKRIHDMSSRTSTVSIILVGAFVSAVELPCTGGPYLAIVTLLSQYFDFTAFLLLILYNIIFVAPLVAILILVVAGKSLYNVKKWKQEYRGVMRLCIGMLLVLMGWLLILIANGTVNLG